MSYTSQSVNVVRTQSTAKLGPTTSLAEDTRALNPARMLQPPLQSISQQHQFRQPHSAYNSPFAEVVMKSSRVPDGGQVSTRGRESHQDSLLVPFQPPHPSLGAYPPSSSTTTHQQQVNMQFQGHSDLGPEQFQFMYSEPLKDGSNSASPSSFSEQTRRSSRDSGDTLFQSLASAGSGSAGSVPVPVHRQVQINRVRSWSESSNGLISGLAGLGLTVAGSVPSPQNSFVDASLHSALTAFGTPTNAFPLSDGTLEDQLQALKQDNFQHQYNPQSQATESDLFAELEAHFNGTGSGVKLESVLEAPEPLQQSIPLREATRKPPRLQTAVSHLSMQFQNQQYNQSPSQQGYHSPSVAAPITIPSNYPPPQQLQFFPQVHAQAPVLPSQQPQAPFPSSKYYSNPNPLTMHSPLDPYQAPQLSPYPFNGFPQSFSYQRHHHMQPSPSVQPPSPFHDSTDAFSEILRTPDVAFLNGQNSLPSHGGFLSGFEAGSAPISRGGMMGPPLMVSSLGTIPSSLPESGSHFFDPSPASSTTSPSDAHSPPYTSLSSKNFQQAPVFVRVPNPQPLNIESPSNTGIAPHLASNPIPVGSPTRAGLAQRRGAAAPGSLRNKDARKPYSHPIYEDEHEEAGDESEDEEDFAGGKGSAGLSGSLPKRSKGKGYTCPVKGCGKMFLRSHNLKNHLAVHEPAREKAFVCPAEGCHKKFTRVHDLERHKAVHAKVKDFPCKYCGAKFSRIDASYRHMRQQQCGSKVNVAEVGGGAA